MAAEPTQLIDLSHTVEDGMITYKGLPAPIGCDYLSRAGVTQPLPAPHGVPHRSHRYGEYWQVWDSPFHRYSDGKDLSELALESLANLECVVLARLPQHHSARSTACRRGTTCAGWTLCRLAAPFYAVPVKVKGMGMFPVRASARI
ncbi:MAG TPA: hypothetical protein VK993_06675 [Chthoniobacterales bacterium]|nr:hypothetical protein [Chthoniobacterales bacterium]